MIPVLTAGHAALVGEELFVSEFHRMITFSFYIRRYKAAETQDEKVERSHVCQEDSGE